ncbi:MAG: hypothetical protein JXR73_06940 [Candidatus Omnitrophica bacterium]|nr:hypothetical protein [Candidatus Omnitrophota bacterium]
MEIRTDVDPFPVRPAGSRSAGWARESECGSGVFLRLVAQLIQRLAPVGA